MRGSWSMPAARRAGIALLLVVALLAAACSSNDATSERRGGGTGREDDGSKPGVSSNFSLGDVRSMGDATGCLPGDKCKKFEVDCRATGQVARGYFDIGDPVGPARGLLVFLSGGGGNKLWSDAAKLDLQFAGSKEKGEDPAAARLAGDTLQALRDQGYMTVQVVWRAGWLSAPRGSPVGPAHLACRPATLLKWLHDTYFEQLGAPATPLECGFCLTGNSGGASQIAYSLAFYGLSDIIDAAVLTGGPPHAALHKACLDEPGYGYSRALDAVIDISYGFYKPQRGPCVLHDPSWADTWKGDGLDTGGSDYSYPDTRVLLLLGELDETEVGPHQMDYLARLEKAGSAHAEQATIPNMTHAITTSEDGVSRITDWFLRAA